ncbi:transposase [Mycobacterium tuberculosis M1914]|nr:transposase [Mycobacterium tuberculosis M1914]
MRASPADGLAITGLSWKGSRGGSVREVRGGTCPLSSGRGKRCGSAITVGRWMVPATRCSPTLPRCSGWTLRWPRISRSCCRWIPRTCGHTSIRRAPARTRSPQGALSNYKKSADEPDDHAIGRSRGGLTTKIHALTDQREAPVRIRLTAGQAGDNPQLLPLLDDYRNASTEYALGSTDFRLLADKAYSHPSTRAALRSKKIKHTIPERQDQIDRRKAKGSAGGRPPAFDAALYGLRNTVERGFHRLKQWRGIATRYDKYALTYLGGVLLACAVIHARVGTPKLGDTP